MYGKTRKATEKKNIGVYLCSSVDEYLLLQGI